MDLKDEIKTLKDEIKTLKKENKTLKNVMSKAPELLECYTAHTVQSGQEEMNDTLKKENGRLKHVMTNAGHLLEHACSMVEQ
tara:strand:+ start:412 stop:657 length:246 start_codon:yes stop_codon:yes gene_type:complete